MAGLYVSGVKKPYGCTFCPWCRTTYCFCTAANKNISVLDMNKGPDWCPLVEVPDHGGLVDKKKLVEALGLLDAVKYGNTDAEQQRNSYETLMRYEIADILDDAEIVIPEDKEEE